MAARQRARGHASRGAAAERGGGGKRESGRVTCRCRRDQTCPVSTGGGTRRVQSVREGGSLVDVGLVESEQRAPDVHPLLRAGAARRARPVSAARRAGPAGARLYKRIDPSESIDTPRGMDGVSGYHALRRAHAAEGENGASLHEIRNHVLLRSVRHGRNPQSARDGSRCVCNTTCPISTG
jgi:hypothetical protein